MDTADEAGAVNFSGKSLRRDRFRIIPDNNPTTFDIYLGDRNSFNFLKCSGNYARTATAGHAVRFQDRNRVCSRSDLDVEGKQRQECNRNDNHRNI